MYNRFITIILSALFLFAANSVAAQPGCIGFDADFDFSTDSINDNLTVYFTNTSTWTDSTTKYKWDFGDGSLAFAKDTTHKYTAYNNYLVKLYATNIKPNGDTTCRDSISKFILLIISTPKINGKSNPIKATPVPFDNNLTLNAADYRSIEIVNIIGEQMYYTADIIETPLNITTENWPSGVYTIISVDNNGYRSYLKIAK